MIAHFPANDCWGESSPRCPYCNKHVEPNEHSRYRDIEDYECEFCGKRFITQTRETIEYDTVGDCENNGHLPHQLKPSYFVSTSYSCKNCHGDFYDFDLQKMKSEDYVILEKEETL